jgi:Secretion system C-terminal sorting domain
MKKKSVKKHIAYIIALMMFSVMPALVDAQKKCPDGNCPSGFYCADGRCVKIWTGPVCPKCPWQIINNYGSQSASVSFSLDKSEKISVKIFDLTGRLIKTLADKIFEQGVHELQWNATGVKTGIYIAQLNTGTYREKRKISVVK